MPGWPAISISTIDGQPLNIQSLQGKVVLWVNTASACGFTPQLSGLQLLHEQYADRGLTVIGSPCNQFGGQDPAPVDQIHAFCQQLRQSEDSFKYILKDACI